MLKFTDFLGAFTKPVPVEPAGLSQLWARSPRVIEASGNADLTETEMGIIYGDLGLRVDDTPRNACPDCRHSSLYAGPQGGGSQNWRCVLCGMGYNLTGRLGDHRIGLPDHLWSQKIKDYRNTLRALLDEHGFQTSKDNWGIAKDGHHGIWIWPHNNFATIPALGTNLKILTWNVFKWDEHLLQLPDPDFISKLQEALVDDDAHL